MTAAGHRIYRTADGRHVLEGHPDAAFLAYAPDDEAPAEVLAEIEGKVAAGPAAAKRSSRPADKAAAKPADK